MIVAVQLPVMFCPTCPDQLVNHMFVVVATVADVRPVLVCGVCAQAREAAGERYTLAAVQSLWSGMLTYPAPSLSPEEGFDLVVRLGARLL